MTMVWISPGCSRPLIVLLPPATIAPPLSYHVSVTDSRAIGALDALRTLIVVWTLFCPASALVTGWVNSTAASPLIGGVIFLPASTDCSGWPLVGPASGAGGGGRTAIGAAADR